MLKSVIMARFFLSISTTERAQEYNKSIYV